MTNTSKNIKQKAEEIEENEELEENNEFEEVSLENRVLNVEKKVNIILFLTIVIAILCIILMFGLFGSSNENTSDESYSESESETTSESGSASYSTQAFKEITAQDIATESKSSTIVVMIGRQGCGWCAQFAPLITSVAEDFNITIRYIDLAKIVDFTSNPAQITDEEAFSLLSSLKGDGEWENFASDNMGGTPLTLIIKNSKVIGGIGGYVETSKIEEAFENAGLKK